MSGRVLLAVAVIGAAALGGCGLVTTDALPSADPEPAMPGIIDELPEAAAMASSWESGDRRLPAGIDLDARYADEIEATFAVTEPFGRRPMPPGSEGIESHGLEAPSGEMRLLVTYPVFDDPELWGEQFLLVLRQGSAGWFLREAHVRELCTADGMARCHD